MVQLSHPFMTTGKTIALTRRTFVDKVMCLLFNMLSGFVIASIIAVVSLNFPSEGLELSIRGSLMYPEDVMDGWANENPYLAPHGTSKRAVSGEAWSVSLCGESTHGVLAYSKSLVFPSDVCSSPHPSLFLFYLPWAFSLVLFVYPKAEERAGFNREESFDIEPGRWVAKNFIHDFP